MYTINVPNMSTASLVFNALESVRLFFIQKRYHVQSKLHYLVFTSAMDNALV